MNKQQLLVGATTAIFAQNFNYQPHHVIQAPGRVNLIGEHTDYNDGFVLPCAIDFQTIVCASPRNDSQVRVIAADYDNQLDTFNLDQPVIPHSGYMWANYIRGMIKHLQQNGFKIGGADLVVSGNVPQGAGLSSSASLEVAIGQTFKTLFDLDISQQDIALIAQQAENQFVGCNCGIMDQLISAKGEYDHALLLDCRSLETKSVIVPPDLSIIIINSNVKRGLVDSEYNTRRQQCEDAARFFEVKALRDVSAEQLDQQFDQLESQHPKAARRARHVITENERTLAATSALTSGDIKQMASLMAQSHASMRDDFEITVPQIDSLVNIIKEVIGEQGGVRMTGGGFGGCVVSLVPTLLVDSVVDAVNQQYQQATGIKETIYICRAMAGASEISS